MGFLPIANGDKGADVELIQRMLVHAGFDTIDDEAPKEWRYDGDFGPLTEKANLEFRQSINPELTSGATVTPWTFFQLLRHLKPAEKGFTRDEVAEILYEELLKLLKQADS